MGTFPIPSMICARVTLSLLRHKRHALAINKLTSAFEVREEEYWQYLQRGILLI